MIYGYVCGNETIHVFFERTGYDKDGSVVYRLAHGLCCALESQETQRVVSDAPSAGLDSKSWVNPHRFVCDFEPRPPSIGGRYRNKTPSKLDTSFLRICRQVYNEARLVLYENPRFSFKSPEVLDTFMTRTTHINCTRRLRLEVDIADQDDDSDSEDGLQGLLDKDYDLRAWQNTLQVVVQKMTNLKHLHIDVRHDRCQESFFPRSVEHDGKDKVTEVLLVLGRLPLKAAKVTWLGSDRYTGKDWDWDWDSDSDVQNKWTKKEQEQWTKALQDGRLGRKNSELDVAE